MYPIKEVSNGDVTFGAIRVADMMPAYKDIPEEFRNFDKQNKWIKLFEDIFFNGVKNLKLDPKKDVDPDKAYRHIRSIMKSWNCKHEHKTAGCAFLFSEWFEDAKWEVSEQS
jgi:hypothetical protein